MSKKLKKTSAKYKKAVCGCIAVLSCFAVFAGACAETTTEPEEETNTSTRVDEQVLKNGNFEFFSDNDGTYLLGVPDNWSENSGSGATASTSGSGVLNTSYDNWQRLTDPDLPQTIWNNEALETDDENYVNYNGTPFDLPFADPASAILENEDEDEDDETDDYLIADDAEYIANPGTHNYYWDDEDEDGTPELYDNEGNEVTYYTNDDGEYFFDEDCTEPVESNVLMIHNYVEDDMQGTETYYSSSTTLTLEANTAAKLSVWVKTSDLYFGTVKGNELTRTPVIDQRGAYIQLDQTVGDATLDSFRIENINTEILNPDGNDNGWVEYTLYVSACDYAATTITLTVGLGESSIYTLEGYAFFDDITYEKYLNVDEMVEAAGGQEVFDGLVNGELSTTCNLLSTEEEKTFRVDKETYDQLENTIDNYSSKYDYHIDLAISSSQDTIRHDLTFSGNTEAGLTADADGYVSSNGTPSLYNGVTAKGNGTTYLPRDLNLNIEDDFISTFSIGEDWSWPADVSTGYSAMLSEEIGSAAGLPGVTGSADTLVIMSARGAAYEAVVGNPEFTFEEGEEYKIVSFWVKTSDLAGNTSFSVTARQVGDDDNTGSFEIDTTSIEGTTINDVEDVYNGWVQCFFFISNDTQSDKTFRLEFSYGPTDVASAEQTAYGDGYAAFADFRVLRDVNAKYIDFASSDTYSQKVSLTGEVDNDSSFDTPGINYSKDISQTLAVPANFTGVPNASKSIVTGGVENVLPETYDLYTGLLGASYAENYYNNGTAWSDALNAIAAANSYTPAGLSESEAWWAKIFGDYNLNEGTRASSRIANQPLVVLNTSSSAVNAYGFLSDSFTVSADSYQRISMRVKLSLNATATIYLIDTSDVKAGYNTPLAPTLPSVTFWHDDDGNIVYGDPTSSDYNARTDVLFYLEENGLYTKAGADDGRYYANLKNYTVDETTRDLLAVDADGNTTIAFYYNEADEMYYAYRTETSRGNYDYEQEVYDIYDSLTDEQKADTDYVRYNYLSVNGDLSRYESVITVEGTPENAGRWIEVTFYVHTGNVAKDYRLEVWAGSREYTVNDDGTASPAGTQIPAGAYFFFDDYSSTDVSDNYDSLLAEAQDNLKQNSANLVDPDDPSSNLKDTFALYYTYTFYDAASYLRYDATTDEEGLGNPYGSYTQSTYSEGIAWLRYEAGTNSTLFLDYASTDVTVTADDLTSDDDTMTDEGGDTTGDTNVWLIVSSGVLAFALVFAIVAIIVRRVHKKLGKHTKVKPAKDKRVRPGKEKPAAPAAEEAPAEPKDENDPYNE